MQYRDIFQSIPEELDFMRSFPKEGGWAMIIGNQYAPRGMKFPLVKARGGLRLMDIVWVYNELIPREYLKLNFRSRVESIIEWHKDDKFRRDRFIDYIREMTTFPYAVSDQLTVVTSHSPCVKPLRLYCGELNCIEESKLEEMMDAYIATPIIGSGHSIIDNPIAEETTKHIIESLMLDGLSYEGALNEVIKAGEITRKECLTALHSTELQRQIDLLPGFYYKIKDEYYYVFNDHLNC